MLPFTGKRNHTPALSILAIAGLIYLAEVVWFWRFFGRNVNFDAVSYIGIARHILAGDFRGSVSGYWSPAISWLIAAGSVFSGNLALVGRVITIATFVLSAVLLYLLSRKLWGSSTLGAVAVLWWVLARGVASFSVSFIGADFLLTSVALAYFLVLGSCITRNRRVDWFLLGALHALAFLVKAIAMPWLALTTLAAAVIANGKEYRKLAPRAVAAFVLPVLVWSAWGSVLHAKYGVFMSGYQFRRQILEQVNGDSSLSRRQTKPVLISTAPFYDRYLVDEEIPLGARQWKEPVLTAKAVRYVVRNLVLLGKANARAIVLLVTPGGILAFVIALWMLTRGRVPFASQMAWLMALSICTLWAGYSVVLTEARYMYPVVPLLIAVAVPLIVPGDHGQSWLRARPLLQTALLGLTVATVVFLTVYWTSPFRSIHRDYEASCYDAAEKLRRTGSDPRTVSIGFGPLVEHEVAFEAPVYSAFFAGRELVASYPDIRPDIDTKTVIRGIRDYQPGSVMVWGGPSNAGYTRLLNDIRAAQIPLRNDIRAARIPLRFEPIIDPELGEVGTVIKWPNCATDDGRLFYCAD